MVNKELTIKEMLNFIDFQGDAAQKDRELIEEVKAIIKMKYDLDKAGTVKYMKQLMEKADKWAKEDGGRH